MKEVIQSGKGATIKVLRCLYAGATVSVDDHHVAINENHQRIEIEKSEEGVRLVRITGEQVKQ